MAGRRSPARAGLRRSPSRPRPRCARTPTWADIRAAFPIVGRQVPVHGRGRAGPPYLDHAASTHAPEPVLDRYARFTAGEYANIHRGTHLLSRKATEHFDECYYVVSDFIGGDLERDCVVFLGNTTQAVDLAAHVMARAARQGRRHRARAPLERPPHRNRGPVPARADHRRRSPRHGPPRASSCGKNQVKLVAVTGASNVTGWMPDIHAIARLAHEHGALILVDAAQLLAHQRIDVRPAGDPAHLDFVAAAGHKAYAPFGAAFLYGPRGIMDAAPPYLPGGGTRLARRPAQRRVRASARSPPGRHAQHRRRARAGRGAAVPRRHRHGQHVRQHEVALTRRAMAGMRALGVTLYGPDDPDARLGVLSFNVDGVSDPLAAAVLSEERGIAVRNGRFCAHIHVDRLLASQGGATPEPGSAPGAVRASFGLYNDEADVDRLLEAVAVLRDRRWVGRYRVRAAGVTAEFAGRCNDRWMEADAPSPPAQVDADPGAALLFAQLNPSGPTRSLPGRRPPQRRRHARRPAARPGRSLPRRAAAPRPPPRARPRHPHPRRPPLRGQAAQGPARLRDRHAPRRRAPRASTGRSTTATPSPRRPRARRCGTPPGHTPLAVPAAPDRVLTGDTLWLGGTGGCDVGGDPAALAASLLRLRGLPRTPRCGRCATFRRPRPRHDRRGGRRQNPWLQGDLAQLRPPGANRARPPAVRRGQRQHCFRLVTRHALPGYVHPDMSCRTS